MSQVRTHHCGCGYQWTATVKTSKTTQNLSGEATPFCPKCQQRATASDPERDLQLADLPQPPEGAVFSLKDMRTISLPHPYCVTPKHIECAADHHGGILDDAAIRDAEKRGALCGAGSRGDPCRLPFDKHENLLTVFIAVPNNKQLNETPGLQDYLCEHTAQFKQFGVDGFAFPNANSP